MTQLRRLPFDRTLAADLGYCRRTGHLNLIAPLAQRDWHLRAAQQSLALAAERVRRLPASSGLDRSEVVLLQRLLTAEDASPEGLEEARSVS